MDKDFNILSAIAKGEKSAFKEIYQLYADKVFNTAISYAQNKEDAEEITQEVFINIFKSAGKFKGKSKVSTWIYKITVNTSINFLNKRKRKAFMRSGELPGDSPDFNHPGVLLEQKENAQTLFKVIDALPETQKTAFILSFIEDLPRQEVANIMSISLKAVESLLQRGKKNLRDNLEKHYPHRRKRKK
ncbi:MAG: RNA polymerase sigma factor [Bacteroidota bacterium]